jgi:RNA polymerase sigma-70 factor (ECF subfamily)
MNKSIPVIISKETVMSHLNESDPQEAQLTSKASKMDLEAFNLLVLKYQNLVYNHALALLGDQRAAEDATQESFLKAFKNMGNFRGGSFRPWLMKIATNTCYDELRKGKRRTQISLYFANEYGEEQDSPAWLADSSPSIQSVLEHKELSLELHRMVEELPTEYRSALTLVDIHGLDYAETAQALGIPLGTLKSRLARARFMMRNKLSKHYECSMSCTLWKPSSICA